MAISKITSRWIYALIAAIIFLIEVLIALFVNDAIIRPHVGDLLVVMMIYCFVRAVFNPGIIVSATVTLLFAWLIETLQYFQIVEVLGLSHLLWARIVIGTYFSWIDMLAYTGGIALVLVAEKLLRSKSKHKIT